MIRIAVPVLVLFGALLIIPAYGTELEVFNHSTYIDSGGLPVVAGEIINRGSKPVKSVEVEVSFLDSTGRVLDSDKAVAAAKIIPPGQRAPFMVAGSSDYADEVKNIDLQIVNFAEAQQKPAALEIVSADAFSDGIQRIVISGEVRNAGSEATSSTNVFATFYDDSGNVVSYASASTDPPIIEPGAKSVFTISANERIPTIQRYVLSAESDQYAVEISGVRMIRSSNGDKVSISHLSWVNQEGEGTGAISTGERVWIKSDLKNELPVEQHFAYIVQVKDSDGLPVTISWVDGVLTPDMEFAPKISWVPEEEGIYFAEVFIWNSLEGPVPLSFSIRTIILFVE